MSEPTEACSEHTYTWEQNFGEVCNGSLVKEVDPEESTWCLESGGGKQRVLVVTLHKVNRAALKSAREWPCLLEADLKAVAQAIVDESVGKAEPVDSTKQDVSAACSATTGQDNAPGA